MSRVAPAGGGSASLEREDSIVIEELDAGRAQAGGLGLAPGGMAGSQSAVVPVAQLVQPKPQQRTVFQSFDTDGDGRVDMGEFRAGFDAHLTNNVVKAVPFDVNAVNAIGAQVATIETLPIALKRRFVFKAYGMQAMQIFFVFWTTYFMKSLKYRHGLDVDAISFGGMIPLLLMMIYIAMMGFLYMARAEPEVYCWLFPLYVFVEVIALGSFSWYTNYGFILHMLFYHFLATMFVGLLMQFSEAQLPACLWRYWMGDPDQHLMAGKAGWISLFFLLISGLTIYFLSPAFLQVDPGKHDGQGIKTVIFAWIGVSVIQMTQCWQYEKMERMLQEHEAFRCLCLSHAGMTIVVVIMCLCCTMFCIGGDAGMDGANMDVTSGGFEGGMEAGAAGGADMAGAVPTK